MRIGTKLIHLLFDEDNPMDSKVVFMDESTGAEITFTTQEVIPALVQLIPPEVINGLLMGVIPPAIKSLSYHPSNVPGQPCDRHGEVGCSWCIPGPYN